MSDELIISVYGSHNAAVAMYYKGEYKVVEIERWKNVKHMGLLHYFPINGNPKTELNNIIQYLLNGTGRTDIDVYLTNFADITSDGEFPVVKPTVKFKKHIKFKHHVAHAACSFYQSPYKEALTITSDSGGDDGYMNVYLTNRKDGVTLLKELNRDFGFAYQMLANHLNDITQVSDLTAVLVYPGKLMGLCSYGKVRKEWIPVFAEFYEHFRYTGEDGYMGTAAMTDGIVWLMRQLGIKDFKDDTTRYTGEFAYDLAATTQYAFEQQFFRYVQPFFDEYPDLPVTLSGGCALNVLLNTKVLNARNGKVYIPPNPNDCGIAIGGILEYLNPQEQVDITYAGMPVLDAHQLPTYLKSGSFDVVESIDIKRLAKVIKNGYIVGVINGNSEHGPRALGNRSILCNPIGDMKDVLNQKVKHREWYRPFAPVVRLEDTTKYFDFPAGIESRHMTFVAEVREEYRSALPAITHIDNTARLQTVTREQNAFLYDLLTEFDAINNHGVLLNTSFNIEGNPILTKLEDALKALTKTKLDAVYYENKLIFRKGETHKLGD